MVSKLTLTKKRKLLGVAVMCVVLIAGLTVWFNTGHVAEAAVLNPHPGLVGWWRFDEGSGSAAGDSSGNGNNGAVYGATWVTGKYGKALSFDGVNAYVNCPNIHSNLITVEAWVKRNGTQTTYVNIVSQAYTVSNSPYYEFVLGMEQNNKVRFGVTTNGVFTACVSSSPIPDDSFVHLVGTYNGANVRLYVNAVQVASTAKTGEINNYGRNLKVGTYEFASALCFKGVIDEVRIYDRALSADEIQENPDLSSKLLAKVPKGATQVVTTLSWQGIGSINVTIESPSKNYTEDTLPVYQKTVYSTSSGTSSMLNIKRLSVSVIALSSDENWYVTLEFNNVEEYKITVEVQKIGT